MRSAAVAVLLIACGDPPLQVALTPASAFDGVGVLRIFRDGLTPTELDTFALTMRSVLVSGGGAHAEVERREIGAMPIELSGSYDEDRMELAFQQVSGALTASETESIAIAVTIEDGFPSDDGIGNDLTGFIRTERGLLVKEGQFVAISPDDARPAPVDEAKVTALDRLDGTVEVHGAAGSAIASVGVEILRFTIDRADPDFRVVEAAADGSFSTIMTAIAGDIFLIRNAPAGHRSDARAVRVQ